MSFSMQKLRSLLPRSQQSSAAAAVQRHSVSLEPEVGFQINIELSQHQVTTTVACSDNGDATSAAYQQLQQKTTVPELNVHLIAARHLPTLFGFKVVQGYLIKVKLFPGSKRLDSSIQTNTWPKFNENFKFPLTPDIKPSLKHYNRRSSRPSTTSSQSEFTPEELFEGQFVVFTVYALLELPAASFNRFNKTYRSLRDKSSNLVQKVVESSATKSKDDKENSGDSQKAKRKPSDVSSRDSMPALTISESRRNIGSVTCYLEPKIFKRNSRTGLYATEEIWLPIKDITTSVVKTNNNNLTNAPKGVVELALEMRDLRVNMTEEDTTAEGPAFLQMPSPGTPTSVNGSIDSNGVAGVKHPQWNRMTSEVKRKMGISNAKLRLQHDLELRVTTARMRCSNKVKDELESTAGSVYVKTTVFEHGIYVDSWKSTNFYPSLSTKWDVGDEAATLIVPLQQWDNLEHLLIRTTLATKTKMGKKLVLGTVLVGASTAAGSGTEHVQLLREAAPNERVPMWHSYQ